MFIKLSNKVKAYGICLYKIENKKIKIFLCKSINSKKKWGFLKGSALEKEKPILTAQREFLEESGIITYIKDYEEYFEQKNNKKDIGIWLLNTDKISSFDKYFEKDTLKENFLSMEISKAKFFDIKKLPKIKNNQKFLIQEIIDFLQNKNQFH